MIQIIGQFLLAPLYPLLTTYPRLVVGITVLFLLLGAVVIWALVHKRESNDMAEPILAGQSSPSSGRVKPSSTTTTTTTAPANAIAAATAAATSTGTTTITPPSAPVPAIPNTPKLDALGPASRTSSSSTTSSDFLLPVHVTGQSSSWPAAPIPWRSSWGFLQKQEQEQPEREQEQNQPSQEEQEQARQEIPGSSLPINENGINTDFLMLPPGSEAQTRRTGSMKARKGSACTYHSTLVGLELDIPAATAAARANNSTHDNINAQEENENENDSARSDLAGVGGQFQFF